ncbi:MAG: hypothetical protein H8E15_05110 [Planctomycetes bacterium]|nr:hypothetical protein [Planctomycetota bacterium]
MLVGFLVASVLAPLILGLPRVLDDSRLDGGVIAIVTTLLMGTVLLKNRKAIHTPTGAGWLLLGLACGGIGLIGLEWNWIISGLADRLPLFAAWALLGLAYSFANSLQSAWKWIFWGCSGVAIYNLLLLLGLDLFGLVPAPGLPPTPPLASRAHAAEFLTVFVIAAAAFTTFEPTKRGVARWILLLGPATFMAGYFDLLAGRIAITTGLFFLAWQQRRKLAPAALLMALLFAGETTRIVTAPPFAVQDEGESGLPPWASVQGRAHLYSACLQKVSDAPMGIGFGRFERDYPRWRSLEEQRLSSSNYENITTRRPKTPHSEPLLALVELGWLGAALLAVGAMLLLGNPLRAFQSGQGVWTWPALIALAAHMMVRSPLSDNGPLLAFAALLVGQHAALRLADVAQSAATLPVWRRALAAPMTAAPWALPTLCAILAVLPAPAQIFGELAVAKRIPLTEAQPPEILEAAVEWREWDSRAWGLLAADYSRTKETAPKVELALRQALRFDPTDLWALNAFFKLEMSRGHEQNALELLGIAEAYSPEHPAIRANRTIYLNGRADAYRLNGLELLKNNSPGAGDQLRLSQLFKALADIRDGEVIKAQKALRAAAVYSKDQRGLIERISRADPLTEKKVHALLLQVVPGCEIQIGSWPR